MQCRPITAGHLATRWNIKSEKQYANLCFKHFSRPDDFQGRVTIMPSCHDDVIKWKNFPRNWPFMRGIHWSPVNSPHKDQWRGALMFSLIYAWINDWVNNREAGDLRHRRAHYDVIVMQCKHISFTKAISKFSAPLMKNVIFIWYLSAIWELQYNLWSNTYFTLRFVVSITRQRLANYISLRHLFLRGILLGQCMIKHKSDMN